MRTLAAHGLASERQPLPERYHALDALRATAMLLGIVLHAAISYMPSRMPNLVWAIRDPATSPWMDWLFWGIHAFRMPVFFLIAGFFSALIYERRGAADFLANRTRRVFSPFALAGLVLLPLLFLIWSAGWLISGECTPGQVLRIKFSPPLQKGVYGLAHLWFLEHLFVMCLAFWVWRRWLPSPVAAVRWLDRALASRLKPLWLAIPTAVVVFIWPAAVLDFHQSALPHVGRFLFESMFYVVGLALYGQRNRLHELTRDYRRCLLLAIPVFLSLGLLLPLAITAALPPAGRLALALDSALLAWLMAFGLLGLFVRVFNRPSSVVRYISNASYYIYLVHMPLVALVQITLYPFGSPPALKFLVSLALPTVLCLATYHHLVRCSWLGELLNGHRQPGGPIGRCMWLYAAVPVALCIVLLAGVWRMREFCFDHNLHAVTGGEVYRCAMIDADELNELISRLKLRTVVSVQGGDDGLPWFTAQKRACFARGVQLYVVDLPEDALPSREEMEALIAVLDHAPRPILLQGRFGIARAGLAAAVAQLLSDALPQQAHEQYRLKHGSFDRTEQSTQNVIRAYEAWLASTDRPHTPDEFRKWVSGCYQPWRVLVAVRQGRR
jgi:glucan biosynthesis protein C